MTTIKLNDSDLVICRLVADKRNEMNQGRGDAPAYALNSERMEDNSVAMYASTRCELAVAKVTNRFWHASWWPAEHHHIHKHEPDVGHNIEVKRIRSPHNPLLVKEDYVSLDRVIFLAYAHTDVEHHVDVIGYIKADLAWQIGQPVAWDESKLLRAVTHDMLTPV
jgi:hypothetical protein